jgi:Amt family ammonium transporter
VGTVLAGLFASEIFGGLKGDLAIGRQIGIQLLAASLTVVYTAAMTYALAKAVDAAIGLRIAEIGEEQGLDLHQHGESGYNL